MKKFVSFILSFALVLLCFGCDGNKASIETFDTTVVNDIKEENKVFKIGGIGPITGETAIYGLSVKNAIKIAVDEINANGGMNGYNVEYRFVDDENDVEKSINAYNSLKDWGMQILIGATTSSPCIRIADKSYADNMFQITPSGSAIDCTANPNVFRMCFQDTDQGVVSAKYISEHNIAKKVGIIYDASDVYSTGIYEKFVKEAHDNNIEIVAEEQFTSDTKTDFTMQLSKLKSAGADLVFLPFYYSEAALVLNQAKSMEYKPIFFGCDGIDGILTLESFDKTLAEGLILLTSFSANAQDELTKNFVSKYMAEYNDIPNQFAADAYDCVYALKLAIEHAEILPSESIYDICDNLKSAMTKIDLQGLTGENITFTRKGESNRIPKTVIIRNAEYDLSE